MAEQAVLEIQHLKNYFGDKCVHEDVQLSVAAGEVLAIVGGSGCGKSTLLRSILMMRRPTSGSIKVHNEEITTLSAAGLTRVRKTIGMMFQKGALFGSLTVQENVAFPLRLHSGLDRTLIDEIALMKIQLVGLERDAANLYPSQLSGGMIKRAAVARAMALDPQLLFLDEPTAGLDPQGASEMDKLIKFLNKTLGLTILIVTHDLDTLWTVADRVAFLGEGKVMRASTMAELTQCHVPKIREYFSSPRAQRLTQYMSNVYG